MDTISLIVAAAENGAIGYQGGMPWHISADFRYFRRTTLGHPVVMGRGTWRSLGGRCLSGRRNLVITRSPLTEAERASGAEFYPSPGEALSAAAGAGEIFIIGGGSLYRQTMEYAHRIYLTRIHADVEPADTFFPEIDPVCWAEVLRSICYHDEASGFDYTFLVYERRK